MQGNSGFTLIELMVVIAIIGILASIVLSLMSDTRTHVRNIAIISVTRAFFLDNESYRSSHIRYFNDDCPVAGACLICKNSSHPAWNWPPASAGSEAPFLGGVQGLYPSNLEYGCIRYRALGSNDYQLRFALHHISLGRLRQYNNLLVNVFQLTNPASDDWPCDWFDVDMDLCLFKASD